MKKMGNKKIIKIEQIEKQTEDWLERLEKEPLQVVAECAITQFMILYNIGEDISLIRDKLAKEG